LRARAIALGLLALLALASLRRRGRSPVAAPSRPVEQPASAARGRRRMARLGGILATALVLLAFATLCFVLLGQASGGWRLLPILSGSMTPSMPAGSLAMATPEPTADVRRGQVILYSPPLHDHELTAHRVTRIFHVHGRTAVETKGDANRAPDPWHSILPRRSVWTVSGNVPLLGYVAVLLRRGPVLIAIGVALALVALASLATQAPRARQAATFDERARRSTATA
jgi:signal peptidase I